MERRKSQSLERPQIRISSTFFWHLSSDYDLSPISVLRERAEAMRSSATNLGLKEDVVVYEPMKVGEQVQRSV